MALTAAHPIPCVSNLGSNRFRSLVDEEQHSTQHRLTDRLLPTGAIWSGGNGSEPPTVREPALVSECARHSCSSCSTVPRLLVRLDEQTVHELVQAAKQVDNCHQLDDGFVVQAQLLHRRSMDSQSIVAAVHRGDGDGDDLLRQGSSFFDSTITALTLFQFAFRYAGLGPSPCKGGDEVDLQRALDLLVIVPNHAGSFIFGDHANRRHPCPLCESFISSGAIATPVSCSRHGSPSEAPAADFGVVVDVEMSRDCTLRSGERSNPAITIARTLSDTFAGIKRSSAPTFIVMQLVGPVLAHLIRCIFAPSKLAQPTISEHLRILREAGLIQGEIEGRAPATASTQEASPPSKRHRRTIT